MLENIKILFRLLCHRLICVTAVCEPFLVGTQFSQRSQQSRLGGIMSAFRTISIVYDILSQPIRTIGPTLRIVILRIRVIVTRLLFLPKSFGNLPAVPPGNRLRFLRPTPQHQRQTQNAQLRVEFTQIPSHRNINRSHQQTVNNHHKRRCLCVRNAVRESFAIHKIAGAHRLTSPRSSTLLTRFRIRGRN